MVKTVKSATATPKKKRAAPSVDAVFRAFSDQTRLRILRLLQQGEVCVCDLVSALQVPQPKVSRHLARLRKAGLVKVRKDGLWSYYTLAPSTSAFHGKLIECMTCCFDQVPSLRKDQLRLKKCATTKCC